jgi:hypothetical protein
MRVVLILIGLALVAGGIWVLSGHASYQQTDTLVQIGSAKITAAHDKAVPAWVGIAGVAVGALLAIGGLLKRG